MKLVIFGLTFACVWFVGCADRKEAGDVAKLRPDMPPKKRAIGHVSSGSMAPRLFGPHFEVVCDECRFVTNYDALARGRGPFVVCPNCGFRKNRITRGDLREGDSVWMDELDDTMQINCWDIIAFQHGPDGKEPHAKRVVGLPGQRISIRSGEIVSDGKLTRKDLARQLDAAILVFEQRPEPDYETRPNWEMDAGSGWSLQGGELRYGPETDVPAVNRSIQFIHHSRWTGLHARNDESPVVDHYAFNRSLPRQLNPVGDLLVTFHLMKTEESGSFSIRIHDCFDWFVAEVDYQPHRVSWIVSQGDQKLGRATLDRPVESADRWTFSTFDRQFLIAINNRPILQIPYERSNGAEFTPLTRPVELAGSESSFVIDRFRLYRDIYYLNPQGLSIPWEADHALGDDEYFFIGDNVPTSLDSRSWRPPGVSRKSFVGKVLYKLDENDPNRN